MKYKLIIADDEFFIRQKLKMIIDYKKLDLELAGDFENGLQVIEYLNKARADIVLLDIKMPKYSGLETARYISEHSPDTKVIILSGYNDFEYARTTLRYGVFDYLLKPVENTVLNNTLEKCLNAIKETQQSSRKLRSLLHYEKQLALSAVLKGNMTVNKLYAIYPEFSSATYCAFFSFYTDTDCLTVSRQLTEMYHKNNISCEFFIEAENIFYLQIFLTDEEDLSLCEYLCKVWLKTLNCTYYYCLGELFDIHADWKHYLQSALNRLDHRFFSSRSDLSRQTVPLDKESPVVISSVRQTLLPLLSVSDIERFKKYIHSLFLSIRNSGSAEYLHMVIMEIFATFSVKYSGMKGYRPLPKDYINSLLMEEYSLSRLEERIVNCGLSYLENNTSLPSDIRLSQKIADYLLENYTDPTLNVSSIAAHFDLNASYMGSIFKKVNNKSILQFLTTIRMAEAKSLLQTKQYRIYQIAEKVGYNDVYYFSKRFKKYYGYSPKEQQKI